KTGHPVRSAIHKQLNGRLVLRWVTTWESLLLYVLHSLLLIMSRLTRSDRVHILVDMGATGYREVLTRMCLHSGVNISQALYPKCGAWDSIDRITLGGGDQNVQAGQV
ncbi:hypothetical protein KCU62_g5392, partial [Aureobasidium sp. EXF-3399]